MGLETWAIVRPEHLNHHGFLFGGQLLLWVDEYAWLTAARENPGCRLVTRAMSSIEFHESVPVGAILHFRVDEIERGKTSLHYRVEVLAEAEGDTGETLVFTNVITFVNVDENGNKRDLGCRSDD